MGGEVTAHILEGRSLMPAVAGTPPPAREVVILGYDYSARAYLRQISSDIKSCTLTMVYDGCWKMVWVEGHRPMLFDQQSDPEEFHDLGGDACYTDQIAWLSRHHSDWARGQHNGVIRWGAQIDARCYDEAKDGVTLGFWNEDELDAWRRKTQG